MPNERRWLAVTVIGLSLFLSALDATIVALALPSIANHFQLSARCHTDCCVMIYCIDSPRMKETSLINHLARSARVTGHMICY